MTKQTAQLIADYVLVLIIYAILYHFYISEGLSQSEEVFFRQHFTSLAGLNHTSIILFSAIFIILIANYKNLSWRQITYGSLLKKFLLIIAFAIFWELAFSEYNYYYDSDFIVIKILLLIFALLILWHSIFVFLFLTLALLFWHALGFPIDSLIWTTAKPTFDLLMLFSVFILIKSFYKRLSPNIFIMLAIALHTANYFIPGIAKIEISPHGWEWAVQNNLANLFISAYANGWLAGLYETTAIKIGEFLSHISIVLTTTIVIIQLSALFLLYRKKISLLFFISFELLHLGVFFLSGLLFWQWIIVNLAFIFLLKRLPKLAQNFLYNKKSFYTFLIIIILSPLYYQPIALAWWDSKLHTKYDFYLITKEQKQRRLNRNEFAPYGLFFAQNQLYSIDKEKTLGNNYGAIQYNALVYSRLLDVIIDVIFLQMYPNKQYGYYLFKDLEQIKNTKEAQQILAKKGIAIYNENAAKKLKKFLSLYLKHYDKTKHHSYHKLGAPYHLHDLNKKYPQNADDIIALEIYKSHIWWDENKAAIRYFDRKKVMRINIDNNNEN